MIRTERAFALWHRGVVDNQHRILIADEPGSLIEQIGLKLGRIPDAVRNEMVQLIVIVRCKRSAIG